MAGVLISVPKSVPRGAVFEIRTLLSHPMETGFRPGTNGTIIPRDIVRRFECRYDDVEIFAMTLSPAVAANPFIAFRTIATETGMLVFRWTGDNGFAVEEKRPIVVE